MQKSLRNASVLFVSAFSVTACLVPPARVPASANSATIRLKGPDIEQVTMRRVRVYLGPLVYVARADCDQPTRVIVPKVAGIRSLAFLKNHAPMVACGRKSASIIVPAGGELDPFVIDDVRTNAGFFIACVDGDSRPSEVIVHLTCAQ